MPAGKAKEGGKTVDRIAKRICQEGELDIKTKLYMLMFWIKFRSVPRGVFGFIMAVLSG